MTHLEDEIDFSEDVSSFKSEDISSSPSSDVEEDHFEKKTAVPQRETKPERPNPMIYKKNSGLDKLNKKKQKISETGYRKYGPHSVFLYKPGVLLPDLSEHLNGMIEIRIAREYINKHNKELLKRSIWGSETFTSNSDAVCVLKHTGLVDFNNASLFKNNEGCSLFCKITKARKTYNPSIKNGLKTRGIKGYQGFSLKPDHIALLPSFGKQQEELIGIAERMATSNGSKRVKLTPISNKKNNKFHQNHFVFNLSDELAFKYSISNICDKSNDPTTWTSYQLKKKSLYFESKEERYELANMQREKTEEEEVFSIEDHYKLSKVLKPYFKDNLFMENAEVPLQSEFVQLIFENIEWNDIKWGETAIQIKDQLFEDVLNYKFYQNKEA